MSELYELPDGWEWKKLNTVLDVQNGYAFDSKLFNEELGTQLIRIRDLKNGITTEVRFNGNYDDKFLVYSGDFLIGMDGDFVCYRWKGEPSLLNQRVCRLINFDDKLEPKYVFYGINKYLEEIHKTTAFVTVKHISSKQIRNIEFPLPPLQEQKRIVSKLDTLFEKIDKSIALHQKNMDEADTLMGSVLNEVFGELEERYETTSLDTMSTFQNGFAFKSKEFNTDGLGLRVIRIGNVLDINKNPVFIDERKEFNKYLLKENDIVISMTGTRKKRDYLFVRVVDTNDSYLNQRVGRVSNKDNSNHRYLYYYLQSNYFRDKIFEFETGTVNQGNISGKDIMNSKIPNNPLNIQQKTVKYLDQISEKTEKVKSVQKEKMQSLKALKASLLDRAFRGEL